MRPFASFFARCLFSRAEKKRLRFLHVNVNSRIFLIDARLFSILWSRDHTLQIHRVLHIKFNTSFSNVTLGKNDADASGERINYEDSTCAREYNATTEMV